MMYVCYTVKRSNNALMRTYGSEFWQIELFFNQKSDTLSMNALFERYVPFLITYMRVSLDVNIMYVPKDAAKIRRIFLVRPFITSDNCAF